jgi:N-acetylglucosaminyldiphosphoundecaprenol N-acetyl-beta-D-mannosaminyltransferase
MLRTDILRNMQIHSVSTSHIIELLRNDIDNDIKHQYVSITNTEAMSIGSKSRKHRNYINGARFSLCDGIGLKIAACFHSINISRYHGPDFMIDVIKHGQDFGWSHYFLGGKEEVTKQLKKKVELNYPKSIIKGYYSPPFRKLSKIEEKKMIKDINEVKPNFLWVSLGLPKQEDWINNYKEMIDVNFFVGVGAAFDFHTNNIVRAPLIYQKIGLEWLFRLAKEPRMFVRNLRSFSFMFELIADGVKRKFKK